MAESIKPYQLGLFGHPVKHSQSPRIHAEFAKQFGIELNYQLIDANSAELPTEFKQWIKTAHGCNVTVPHKNNIIPLLDHYTERAHLTQAVNTIYWQDGELWGDNTDGDGLLLDLQQAKNMDLSAKNILIIGAGGAVAGIIPALQSAHPKSINITNRSIDKAQKIAQRYAINCLSNDELQKLSAQDLIINGTSMGHYGLSPDLPNNLFNTNTMAYDLSYGEAATPFTEMCKAAGSQQVFDGIGMLYGQAALAFNIWFNQMPKITSIDLCSN